MRATFVIAIILSGAALCAAMPTEQEQQLIEHQGERFIDGRWQTWDAIKNWFRPASDYVKEQLPNKTPAELADDVKDAAVEFKEKAKDHPVVQTVGNVVKPVHEWVSETANELSKTRFVDMFDNVVDSVKNVDRKVAQWLRPENNNGDARSEDLQVLLH